MGENEFVHLMRSKNLNRLGNLLLRKSGRDSGVDQQG